MAILGKKQHSQPAGSLMDAFTSRNAVPFCLCYLPAHATPAQNINFDLSEIIDLVKNKNKILHAFFAPHCVQKNESQPLT